MTTIGIVSAHIDALTPVLAALQSESEHLARWGRELARRMGEGHRVLAAGNGGSAAEAQHFTAELVGRFDGERRAFSAIALHADTSAMTAIGNDYGFEEVYARQVRAHARPGDILMLLSTSGRSSNLVRAAEVAHELGVTCWSITGNESNPLQVASDDHIYLPGPAANTQEAQLVAIHAICRVFDHEIAAAEGAAASEQGSTAPRTAPAGTAAGRASAHGRTSAAGRTSATGRVLVSERRTL